MDVWKQAEVAMLPKVGKRDRSSPRSWRPIALISCVSKGLERIMAKRIAWTALTNGILSPQHAGALPRRAATDLVACFAHDVEAAMAKGQEVTMATCDVQGAFDALLGKRLLHRMRRQGWPLALIRLVGSFLQNRRLRVRLEKTTTPFYDAECGTPQGSPLSPVLYMLYLAELFAQDPKLRFGYADDCMLYRAGTLETNTEDIGADLRRIIAWGNDNKVFFAPEKFELLHFTRKRNRGNPACRVNDTLTIQPVATGSSGQEPALRWLGVWFDRKHNYHRHVAERAAKASRVAHHLRSIANTKNGPSAAAIRKAVTTCVLPSVLYGTEAWYGGRQKAPTQWRNRQGLVSARQGGHIAVVARVLNTAIRGVLPAFRTSPISAMYRDAGLPPAEVALEDAKIRLALRLQTVDTQHPLVTRIQGARKTGRRKGLPKNPKTKLQLLSTLIPATTRPTLRVPHFTPGSQKDPTGGMDKQRAAAAFKAWWRQIPTDTVTVFSDGSEQTENGQRQVGYGYAVYQGHEQILTGCGAINPVSHVFDAEAIGAWKALEATLAHPTLSHCQIWQCIDSTSVIWCLRGDAAPSSQWAFHRTQDATHGSGPPILTKWSPGHTGIRGNEAADALANQGARMTPPTEGPEARPSISGIRSQAKDQKDAARTSWWDTHHATLSSSYRRWDLEYKTKAPPELSLPRPTLHHLIALRTAHGDFAWYHRKFQHDTAQLDCSCGRPKTPTHLVLCRKTRTRFRHWPERPSAAPSCTGEAVSYIKQLIRKPPAFAAFLEATEFFTRICTR